MSLLPIRYNYYFFLYSYVFLVFFLVFFVFVFDYIQKKKPEGFLLTTRMRLIVLLTDDLPKILLHGFASTRLILLRTSSSFLSHPDSDNDSVFEVECNATLFCMMQSFFFTSTQLLQCFYRIRWLSYSRGWVRG